MDKVGELDLRQQGLLTDNYLSFGNVAEGGVPWSPKQSFTAGGQPDGNVCRAELNGVEVAQAQRAVAAGTKPF